MSYVIVYLPDGEIVKPYSNYTFKGYTFDLQTAEEIIKTNRVLYSTKGVGREDIPYYINGMPVDYKDLYAKIVPKHLLEIIELKDL